MIIPNDIKVNPLGHILIRNPKARKGWNLMNYSPYKPITGGLNPSFDPTLEFNYNTNKK